MLDRPAHTFKAVACASPRAVPGACSSERLPMESRGPKVRFKDIKARVCSWARQRPENLNNR